MFNEQALALKKKFAEGTTSPGIWVNLPSITACEVTAGAGYDWIVADAEHGPFYGDLLLNTLVAYKGTNTVPLVRVPWNDAVMIKQVLDMGWAGVVVPQVNTVEEARQAVAACKYPPDGIRGFGPLRAGNYGRDQADYVSEANRATFCIIQIENIPAAEDDIDEIVRVPGIDGIWVGRNDMSGSIGRFLDRDNPRIWDAVRRIFDTSRAAGIPTGNAVDGVDTIEQALDMGCQWIVVGNDVNFLREATDKSLRAYEAAISRVIEQGTNKS